MNSAPQVDAAEVARKLTEAQRKALIWMSPNGDPRVLDKSAPREVSFWCLQKRVEGDPAKEVARIYSLCTCGKGDRQPGKIWPDRTWSLTPLGLAVRDHILSENSNDK